MRGEFIDPITMITHSLTVAMPQCHDPHGYTSTPRSFTVVALALAHRDRTRRDLDPRRPGDHDCRCAGRHPHPPDNAQPVGSRGRTHSLCLSRWYGHRGAAVCRPDGSPRTEEMVLTHAGPLRDRDDADSILLELGELHVLPLFDRDGYWRGICGGQFGHR